MPEESDTPNEPAAESTEVHADASKPAVNAEPQENPLINILLNVIVPAVVLSHLSKEDGRFALGPQNALIVAVLIPIGYGIYHFVKFRKVNLFSVLGFVSVVLTGGLGLMKTEAIWFALKEALVPLILGLAILLSQYFTSKPLVRVFLFNPDFFDVPRIERVVEEKNEQVAFDKTMRVATWLLAGSFLLSTVLNFILWMYLLRGKLGGSTEYMEAIGKGTWVGFLVIGLPAMAILLFTFLKLMGDLSRITGLNKEELMLPR